MSGHSSSPHSSSSNILYQNHWQNLVTRVDHSRERGEMKIWFLADDRRCFEGWTCENGELRTSKRYFDGVRKALWQHQKGVVITSERLSDEKFYREFFVISAFSFTGNCAVLLSCWLSVYYKNGLKFAKIRAKDVLLEKIAILEAVFCQFWRQKQKSRKEKKRLFSNVIINQSSLHILFCFLNWSNRYFFLPPSILLAASMIVSRLR